MSRVKAVAKGQLEQKILQRQPLIHQYLMCVGAFNVCLCIYSLFVCVVSISIGIHVHSCTCVCVCIMLSGHVNILF